MNFSVILADDFVAFEKDFAIANYCC
jgi:hypothetical protein